MKSIASGPLSWNDSLWNARVEETFDRFWPLPECGPRRTTWAYWGPLERDTVSNNSPSIPSTPLAWLHNLLGDSRGRPQWFQDQGPSLRSSQWIWPAPSLTNFRKNIRKTGGNMFCNSWLVDQQHRSLQTYSFWSGVLALRTSTYVIGKHFETFILGRFPGCICSPSETQRHHLWILCPAPQGDLATAEIGRPLRCKNDQISPCAIMCPSDLVAQCSATPATVAATPPCSATPFQTQLSVRHLPAPGGGEVRHQDFEGV